MVLTEQDFSMYAGDDQVIEFSVTDESEAALNITGASIEWVLWDGDTIVLRKTVGSGIIITDGAGGLFEVVLAPADTYAVTPKAYKHGANVSIEAGAYITISSGVMTLNKKVRQ